MNSLTCSRKKGKSIQEFIFVLFKDLQTPGTLGYILVTAAVLPLPERKSIQGFNDLQCPKGKSIQEFIFEGFVNSRSSFTN